MFRNAYDVAKTFFGFGGERSFWLEVIYGFP
jgi:hypothetical protein